ncbi:ABC transporter ATP-binding protein [Clostridium sp. HCP1S3_B4]|uniref:ABC transporter ATP-binding protein n=1 Tax=unclassified Clostridium TaxID=2614128 RepID=UPI0016A94F49|nr:ABC transporter ATP-binding protein [Clostridiales bacterium]
MIEANNISKIFIKDEAKKQKKFKLFSKEVTKVEFYALNNVSFAVDSGEIVGVLGPNGAGKTTLLRIISGLMKPTSGQVVIKTKDKRVLIDPIEIKKNIGYLSENTKLYGRFSIREILNILGKVYKMEDSEIENRINEIFNLMNLQDFGDNRIEKLSTGQKQRASIARCLIHNPDIYIFDEPTLGLDILSSETIINFMKGEKKRGKSVIYSTHYMEEAEFLCDRIVMIHKGKIIASGTPEELKKETSTNSLRETFKSLVNLEAK